MAGGGSSAAGGDNQPEEVRIVTREMTLCPLFREDRCPLGGEEVPPGHCPRGLHRDGCPGFLDGACPSGGHGAACPFGAHLHTIPFRAHPDVPLSKEARRLSQRGFVQCAYYLLGECPSGGRDARCKHGQHDVPCRQVVLMCVCVWLPVTASNNTTQD